MDEGTSLVFYVNGKKVVETSPNPETTVLQYLRQKLRLTGSKNACNQGGCGACTVMLSKYDKEENRIRHFTVNACITLLCSIHGYAVTTAEGIGSTRYGLHPVQQSLAKSHGIQCGFCTPGMVMTLYCLLRNKQNPTQEDVERVLEGNLCRCTGYRPIIESMKPYYDCPMGEQCCKNKSQSHSEGNGNDTIESEFKPNDDTQDVIFPPELKTLKIGKVAFKGRQLNWMKPTKLQDVLNMKKENPDAKIVMGATALSHILKSGQFQKGMLIDCTEILEMRVFKMTSDCLQIGSALTFSNLEDKLNEMAKTKDGGKSQLAKTFLKCIRWLAADQIRNIATVGGHIGHADPLSDLNPLLVTVGANVELIDTDGQKRSVPLDNDFFCGPYRTSLTNQDTIMSVFVPYPSKNDHLDFFKQPQRRGFSYAIVNVGIMLSLEQGSKIKSLRCCLGGVTDRTHLSTKCMEVSSGLILNEESVGTIIDALIQDLSCTNKNIEKYNLTLANSFVFKFFSSFTLKNTSKIDESAVEQFQTTPFESIQVFESVPVEQDDNDAVGRPIPHLSADNLTCGEALFIDDMPRFENELFLCPVFSTKAHANIINVDTTAALEYEGVVEYIDHRSIVGTNRWGYMDETDEELFASEKVISYGQLVGAIVAESRETASKAAKLVKIQYEELKPILTIDEAIEARSFYEHDGNVTVYRDIEDGFKKSCRVIEGKVCTGGQDHFYLEPLAAVALPKIEQNEMEIFVGTQTPTMQQKYVAAFLGIPANKVVIRHKRTGGAFGGKESQIIRVCGPAAIAASRNRRPVRCILERWQNLHSTGKRHPFMVKYKVGFTEDGRILALYFDLYANGGHTRDISIPIMLNARRTIDNCYNIPNLKIEEHVCKTNTSSNTSFRGFGGPQAIVAIETVITEIAVAVGKTSEEIREMHFYKEGDTTHLGMPLSSCNIDKCWSQCRFNSKFVDKRKEIETFNRNSKWKKRGISMTPIKFPIGFSVPCLNQGSCLIHIYLDGSVSLAHGACEIGQGINTKMIQVASRALGIPVSKIYTSEMSTSTVANSMSTAGSTTTDIIGAAVYDGCIKLKERLQPFKDKNPSASWEELVGTAYFNRVSLSIVGVGLPKMTETGLPFYYFSFGSACSTVEIDCLTGEHQVLSTDIVMDVGKSLNPAIDIGQIEGGFVQGYGFVTLEELKLTRDGVPICDGPINYKIPCVRNIPREFKVSLLKDCPNTKAVYSSKGIGEPPFLLAVSVLMAIKEAIFAYRSESGLKDNFELDCPATSETIRMACVDTISKKCDTKNERSYIRY